MNDASLKRRPDYWSLLIVPVYVLLCLAVFPYFKEIIDPDDTNYLKIAERYAAGNWRTAVNGMWSPLNSWIGALLLPIGVKGLFLFKYLNIAFGGIALLAIRQLLHKSGLAIRYHIFALVGLLPFALYATYHELAADWLQCTIILLYLNLIFSPKYPEKVLYPLVCGVLGAFAYYAKYYNFHFFWLSFIVLNFFQFYRHGNQASRKKFWIYTASGILMLLLFSAPWIILLHEKYHFWKLNYTGVYDLAWSLDPALVTKHTKALLPATQPGAASYLEDPIWLKHDLVTPFSGAKYFIRQFGVSCLSLASLLESLSFFSVFLPAIIAIYIFRFFRDGSGLTIFNRNVVLTIITLPLGYFMFHVEPRFIWPIYILGYILGLQLLVQEILPQITSLIWRRTLVAGFILSCCIQPAIHLGKNFHRDDEQTQWAMAIEPYHLQGSFITNGEQNKAIRLAYLTRMSLAVHKEAFTPDDLISDISQQKVNYYLEFNDAPSLLPLNITGQLVEITGGKIRILRIYRLF